MPDLPDYYSAVDLARQTLAEMIIAKQVKGVRWGRYEESMSDVSVTVTTVETLISEKSIDVPATRPFMVAIRVHWVESLVNTCTFRLYIDDALKDSRGVGGLAGDVNYYVLAWPTESFSAGTHKIKVTGQMDTGTMTMYLHELSFWVSVEYLSYAIRCVREAAPGRIKDLDQDFDLTIPNMGIVRVHLFHSGVNKALTIRVRDAEANTMVSISWTPSLAVADELDQVQTGILNDAGTGDVYCDYPSLAEGDLHCMYASKVVGGVA